jgi:hypothetical protein
MTSGVRTQPGQMALQDRNAECIGQLGAQPFNLHPVAEPVQHDAASLRRQRSGNPQTDPAGRSGHERLASSQHGPSTQPGFFTKDCEQSGLT